MSVTVKDECLVGTFANHEAAEQAIRLLQQHGFAADQLALVAQDFQGRPELREAVSHDDKTHTKAAIGAGTGGLLGLVAGAALLTVPGIGFFALPATMAAAMTGSIVGGLVGAMSGWGIPEEQAEHYQSLVKQGHLVLTVFGNPKSLAEAKLLLEDETAAEEVALHQRATDETNRRADLDSDEEYLGPAE